ncbi:MAG: hypothetical protein AAF546_00165 [Verrucomicrobiota bacterium]
MSSVPKHESFVYPEMDTKRTFSEEELEAYVEERAIEKTSEYFWLLFSRLTMVKSVMSHALWHAIDGRQNAKQSESANKLGVTKQRFHSALNRALHDIEKSRHYGPLPDNVIVKFHVPKIVTRHTGKRTGPSRRKRRQQEDSHDRNFRETGAKKKKRL